ncbi:hypothetical protein A2U01_0074874, partial [Trifolium medium]|nr:hypothetical protein [Trifolium medium]
MDTATTGSCRRVYPYSPPVAHLNCSYHVHETMPLIFRNHLRDSELPSSRQGACVIIKRK